MRKTATTEAPHAQHFPTTLNDDVGQRTRSAFKTSASRTENFSVRRQILTETNVSSPAGLPPRTKSFARHHSHNTFSQ